MGILPSKVQKGQKRGKKALTLKETKENMIQKEISYLKENDRAERQKLKN